MTRATPPRWAETVLRLLLEPRDRQTVPGDLLEEYRESIHPLRGQHAADRWYARQVVGFAWRGNRLWAFLLAGSFIARTALDWLVPPIDFHTRSAVSTALAAGILLASGFWAAWRSSAVRSGALAGVATTAIAALVSAVGTASLLAIWHDPQTLAAIRGSGGLEEVFALPAMMVVPGAFLGTLGGVLGGIARRVIRRGL